ncbi:MAG: SIS domain-containing protein [Motilibacteraceae bacterium]
MDAALFRADLDQVPARLRALADLLDEGAALAPVEHLLAARPRRVVLLGMGSSRFGAGPAARLLRAAGIDAVSDSAAAEQSYPPSEDLLAVAVSATGASGETLAAAERYRGRAPLVAVVNRDGAPLADLADASLVMAAGEERGGVACRTYRHTLALLLALAERLAGREPDVSGAVRRAAEASEELLADVDRWLPEVAGRLDGGAGIWCAAPVERLGSAEQSALMLREGPRRMADACETADWSHVDVYLTKTLDYRLLLLTGSRWEPELLRWCRERETPVVAVGPGVPGAAAVVRHRHDDEPVVRLLTEPLVAELLAATWWGG